MYKIFILTVTLIIFLAIKSQSQIATVRSAEDGVNYSYDDSILEFYHIENEIVKPASYLIELRKVMDSVSRLLSLTHNDKISVKRNIAVVIKDGLIGFVDFNGHVVIVPEYQQAFNVEKTNYWIVNKNNKWGLINPLSKKLAQFDSTYNSVNTLGSGFYGYGDPNRYIVAINGLFGVLDSLENVVIPFEYAELDYHMGFYRAKKGGYWGFIDSLNNITIPFTLDASYHFGNNDLAPAKKVKWGLINRKGDFVIPPKYDDMFTFQKGILRVKQDNKVGFLNEQGEEVIPIIYDDADAYYNNDVLRVKRNNKYAILAKTGKELCDFKYDVLSKFKYNCSMVKVGNLVGVINNSGEEIIPVKYESVDIQEDLITVFENGMKKYFSHNRGKITD
jgi:hypothetical protein